MTRKTFQEEIKKITDQIIKNYRPEKIILFGSAVSGKTHQWSDVDIVVIKSTGKRFYERIGEVSRLVDHILPIDFIVYTPDEFRDMAEYNYFVKNEIMDKGQIIYEQKE